MTSEQKLRLQNRVATCNSEIALANKRLASDASDLRFWKNELQAAQAELIGIQLTLNLRCSTCGD